MRLQTAKCLALLALSAAGAGLAGCSAVPKSDRQTSQAIGQSGGSGLTFNADERQCLARLGATQASFSPLPDKYYGAGCSTVDTVQLSALYGDTGRMSVSNIGPLACPLANTFAAWARYGVDRAARQMLGSPLARIETMGSYSCRNVEGTARRSAHSTAQAIDVSAFVLEDGRRISVLGGWNGTSQEQAFLRIIHESACKRFGTVLGPDYNSAHRNHFHLESSGENYCR